MGIKELLEVAKNTPVTSEQLRNIRVRLQQVNGQTRKSSSTSKQFLARTYSL